MIAARMTTILAACILAVALCLGAVWFPRDAEPGRSHAGGYRLNALAATRAGATPDWYVSGATRATTTTAGLRVVTGAGTIQILTRPLAVFAGRCYSASVVFRLRGPRPLGLAVMDEDATRTLARTLLRPGPQTTRSIDFDSGSRRSISIAIVGGESATFTLHAASLVPAPDTACRT
jgi:hypothetical protein